MFQCLGLGTTETGGCGEDWYHPGCLVGLGPEWFEGMKKEAKPKQEQENGSLPTISEDTEAPAEAQPPAQANHETEAAAENDEDDDPPMPPGFPEEEDFEGFLCYKCVNSQPWIKKYAGAQGFLPPVFAQQGEGAEEKKNESSNKRKAEDDIDGAEVKRVKSEEGLTTDEPAPHASATQETAEAPPAKSACKLDTLPEAPQASFSLFFREDFRENLCKCSDCFVSRLNPHPQLLEEEETYEPPLSEGGGSEHGGSTNGSGSLLDRGESALRNVDRVRAIEGVMAYNHLKDKLKPFFQQFAESGQAIGAEDIKAYFAKLRGDEQGIQQAGEAAGASGSGEGGGDNRREQSGF
jgi:E3 ubiquitin-protein ligase UBR7